METQLNPLYSQQSTVQLSAFGAIDDDEIDVEQGDAVKALPEPEPCSTPSAVPLIEKPRLAAAASRSKFFSFASFHRRTKDEAHSGPTKYRPSITRGSMVILQKAKADVGGLLRHRGGARVAAAGGPEGSWGSVSGSDSLSGSSGGSNPPRARISREGSAGSSVFDLLNGQEKPKWQKDLSIWLDGLPGTMAITFFTLIALFMDDFRLAVLPPLLDPGCEVFAGAIVVVFALDLVFGSFTRDGYFLRTYFWIDMVATFSMLLDMPHFVASVTDATPKLGPLRHSARKDFIEVCL